VARFDRLTVLNTVINTGLMPIFYHSEADVAGRVITALAAGGARVVEFTHRGDLAHEVFGQLVKATRSSDPAVILGVGTILDAPTAALYLALGANFVVGPTLSPEVAQLCNRRKVAYFPGCGSITEISQAEALGVEIVKVFPAMPIGGPEFIRAVLGPCPWTRTLVSGGIEATRESVHSWLQAGASVLGFGSDLIRQAWVQTGQYEAISLRTADILSWIGEARAAEGRSSLAGSGPRPG